MGALASIAEPRAERFNPDASTFEAFALGETKLLGRLDAATLDHATAEATERWHWDRGDRLGIREIGQEDSPLYPFEKQPIDRLHVYAVRRSAPLNWRLDKFGRSHPVYKYRLELICSIDLRAFSE